MPRCGVTGLRTILQSVIRREISNGSRLLLNEVKSVRNGNFIPQPCAPQPLQLEEVLPGTAR